MATAIEQERIYRVAAADGWTYLVAQPHDGRTILGTINGRPIQGHKHLYVRDDGHLTGIVGRDLEQAVTIDDLVDTGLVWSDLDSWQGYRRWLAYLDEFSPSLPLHFGCDHEDGPCQETRI